MTEIKLPIDLFLLGLKIIDITPLTNKNKPHNIFLCYY